MSALVPLRLVRAYRLWNAGEVAGFPAAEAEAMVAAGTAAPLDAPAAPPPQSPDFEAMTKAEIVTWASGALGATLDDRATKPELVAQALALYAQATAG